MDFNTTNLIDFQHNLLSAVSDQSVSTDSFVALKLDNDLWLIDLAYLQEASVPSKIARHAQAPNWIVGIANFKGDVWTIIDMKMVLKNEATLNPSWGWVTLLRHESLQFASKKTSQVMDSSPKKSPLNDDIVISEQKKEEPQAFNLIEGGVIDTPVGLLWTEIVEIAPKGEYDTHPMRPEKWCRAHYKDKNGQVWKELDVLQIMGVGGLTAHPVQPTSSP